MKRLSVTLVVAGLLSVTIPGGAVHAAPESRSLDSVVKAIRKQFAKKSSVRFTVKRAGGPPATWDMKASGAYRFNASGVYAADTTEITQQPDGTGRDRGISIGRTFYSQAYVRAKNGKYIWKSPSTLGKWSYGENFAGVIWGEDLINGVNPGFLKLGASHGATSADGGTFEGVKTTLHSGTVKVPVLSERQAGMSFETEEKYGSWGGPITWKLWVGPDNLPRRFHAIVRFIRKGGGGEAETMTMNIPAPLRRHRPRVAERLVSAERFSRCRSRRTWRPARPPRPWRGRQRGARRRPRSGGRPS
ncbi:hypothetical protein SAMN05444920_110113 [Nonomuraea solani]|uniref:Uncharacterized protein n=1 Tax=Nonomuraea solani TaxID=1144553 RepID=A0A1H6EG95_9ACTN|nr:hypothetical protein [Nonomuraea solani]SEG96802.1 hypothetical protein SAMN05444920_110113 [Nonomuraea solani]